MNQKKYVKTLQSATVRRSQTVVQITPGEFKVKTRLGLIVPKCRGSLGYICVKKVAERLFAFEAFCFLLFRYMKVG